MIGTSRKPNHVTETFPYPLLKLDYGKVKKIPEFVQNFKNDHDGRVPDIIIENAIRMHVGKIIDFTNEDLKLADVEMHRSTKIYVNACIYIYFFERFCYAKILSPCDKSLVKIL